MLIFTGFFQKKGMSARRQPAIQTPTKTRRTRRLLWHKYPISGTYPPRRISAPSIALYGALWFAFALFLASLRGWRQQRNDTTTTVTTVALKATSVATGDTHTCTVLPDKTVKCWGDNTYGQLGTDWTLPRAYNPISVSGVAAASAVAGGAVHTCALLSNGTVRCWGSNISGQLGDDSTTDSFTPVAVSGLSNATAITASHARLDSYGHTCALLSNGTVECWGRNIVGQLGTGNTTDSPTPILVSGLSNATAVQAGGFHTCALSAGTIQCWGDNSAGPAR